ncbi:MAG TPA: YdeI/OmpD-associated family protein [Candidatus Limnocylindrales bacterium]|nr:YdeI/OmpD-associated family protein [Candidatus Limnocylindrales bacterium]
MAQHGAPIILFETAAEFEAWLEDNHTDEAGVWLKIARAGSDHRTLTIGEALDLALCFGWIDGQRRSLDKDFYLQSYTPRRKRSRWSRINRDKVAELTTAGRMRPSGLAEVERAKVDGRWEAAYEPQRSAAVPKEMKKALDADPEAAAFFAGLNKVNRFAFIFRFQQAKREQTKANLIQRLHEGRPLY